jgi:hypothetical protein
MLEAADHRRRQTSNACSRTIGLNAALVGVNSLKSRSNSSERSSPRFTAWTCG